MQSPFPHTTTKRHARRHIQKKRQFALSLPEVSIRLNWGIWMGASAALIAVLVFLTTPTNPLLILFFLVCVFSLIFSLAKLLKANHVQASVASSGVIFLLALQLFSMGSVLNALLVCAITICFIGFTRKNQK